MTYNKKNKLRLFEICAGYGSQALALNRLREIYPDFDYELVGWAEFDPEPDANPDIDKQPAVIAHNALHSDGIGKNWGDITKIKWEDLPDFDLLTYSTPCQSVSQAGGVFNLWQNELERLGYENFAQVLNAKDFGVPQNRERIFLISIRNDDNGIVRYHFPKPRPLELCLGDVLEEDVDEKFFLSDEMLARFCEKSLEEDGKTEQPTEDIEIDEDVDFENFFVAQ